MKTRDLMKLLPFTLILAAMPLGCATEDDSTGTTEGAASAAPSADLTTLLGEKLTSGVAFELDDYYKAVLGKDSKEGTLALDELRDVLRELKTRYARCFTMNPKQQLKLILDSRIPSPKVDGDTQRHFATITFSPVNFDGINHRLNLRKAPTSYARVIKYLGYCSSELEGDSEKEWVSSPIVPPSDVTHSEKHSDSNILRPVLNIGVKNTSFAVELFNDLQINLASALERATKEQRKVQVVVWVPSSGWEHYPLVRICDEGATEGGRCTKQ